MTDNKVVCEAFPFLADGFHLVFSHHCIKTKAVVDLVLNNCCHRASASSTYRGARGSPEVEGILLISLMGQRTIISLTHVPNWISGIEGIAIKRIFVNGVPNHIWNRAGIEKGFAVAVAFDARPHQSCPGIDPSNFRSERICGLVEVGITHRKL